MQVTYTETKNTFLVIVKKVLGNFKFGEKHDSRRFAIK